MLVTFAPSGPSYTQFLNTKALLITRESVGSNRPISGGQESKGLLLVPGLLCQGLEITHQLSLSHWCVGLPGLRAVSPVLHNTGYSSACANNKMVHGL